MCMCPTESQLAALSSGNLGAEGFADMLANAGRCAACYAFMAKYLPAGGQKEYVPLLHQVMNETPPKQLGNFPIEGMLGQGGMSKVYVAHQPRLDRKVAIKVLRTQGASQNGDERLRREARAMAKLSHPNVATIFDVLHLGQDGIALVYELIPGTSLDKLDKPVAKDELLRIAVDLASGLEAAHEAGVLHRDIKPANAIRSASGVVKLLDFGLAKLSENQEPEAAEACAPRICPLPPIVSRTADILGTPLYMAPEVWLRQSRGSVQADLYSLGVLLYELACGEPPHRAHVTAALGKLVCEQDALPLKLRAPSLDLRLCGVIDWCLKRDPCRRPSSAREFLAELRDLSLDSKPSTLAPPVQNPKAPRPPAPQVRTHTKVLLAIIFVGLLVGAAGVHAWHRAERTSFVAGNAAHDAKKDSGNRPEAKPAPTQISIEKPRESATVRSRTATPALAARSREWRRRHSKNSAETERLPTPAAPSAGSLEPAPDSGNKNPEGAHPASPLPPNRNPATPHPKPPGFKLPWDEDIVRRDQYDGWTIPKAN